MANIFDYFTWRGDLSLAQDSLNEIDCMILARFSYAPFELIEDELKENRLSIKKVSERLLSYPDVDSHVLLKNDLRLLESLSKSERFGDMSVFGFENVFDAKTQAQFSAITIKLDENTYFISYRGTDFSLVGWKEDFNMSFIFPVPSQKMAMDYLNKIAGKINGRFILGGHSKGGNLAVYAAAFCDKSVQENIIKVYNFDGPGFDKKVLEKEGYKKICGRINTFIPQSSVIGLLLEHEESYTIVHSTQPVNIMQHDLFSWELTRNHFDYIETVTNSSKFIDSTLKSWLSNMTNEQREEFVEGIYSVLSETNVQNFTELGNDYPARMRSISNAIKNLDEDTRKAVLKAFISLAKSVKNELTETIAIKK